MIMSPETMKILEISPAVAASSPHQHFSLPYGVDGQNIDARYRNGVLEVHLPKADEVKPKEIQVKIESLEIGQSIPRERHAGRAVEGAESHDVHAACPPIVLGRPWRCQIARGGPARAVRGAPRDGVVQADALAAGVSAVFIMHA